MSSYKTVGIIGGMGPLATSDLYRKIILNTRAESDSEHIHIIIDSNTDIPDRSKAILFQCESPVKHLVKSAQRLERSGAELLVLACNSSHFFLPEVMGSVNVPILNMIDVTLYSTQRMGIKKVALLATEGTVKSGIYTNVYAKNGINVMLPSEIEQRVVTEAIYKGIKALNNDVDTQKFQMLVNRLTIEGAQAVILGCTELPIFVEENKINGVFIDPSLELAKAVILEAGAELKKERSFGVGRNHLG